MPSTILIIEENDLLRQALHAWLQVMFPECYIIEAVNEEEALAISQIISWNLALIDIETSNGNNGLKTVSEIRRADPNASVAVLTSYPETFQVSPLASVSAYIPKHKIISELKTVLTGLLYPQKRTELAPNEILR